MIEQATPELRTDEIDIGALIRLLWMGRWFVAIVTALCVIAGVAYALTAREWFRAEVVVMPADAKSVPGGLAQLGGLASLAGINLGSAGASPIPLAVLKSKEFAREFIQEENLLPVLFADKWDPVSKAWKEKTENRQPDIRDAVKYFNETIRTVTEDKKSGLVTLSVLWTDPTVGADWANALVRRLNDKLRDQALAEAEQSIEYLHAEMASTSITSLQQSIGKVLEAEMQKALMARGSKEYAFKTIDHATPAKVRASPQRKAIVIGSALGGFFASVLWVLIRGRLRSLRRLVQASP